MTRSGRLGEAVLVTALTTAFAIQGSVSRGWAAQANSKDAAKATAIDPW